MAKAKVREKELVNLEPKTGTDVAGKSEYDYFEEYGNSLSSSIVGQLLKFSKGDWLVGEDNEEMEDGTQLVAVMSQLLIGYQKWEDSKPVAQAMGLRATGFVPPKRPTLGDTDESLWEMDDNGNRRDPWQLTNYLLLKEKGAKESDQSKMYTFATSSKGGLGAIVKLSKTYGVEGRMRPGEYPVVALKVSSYEHPNKAFGRIKVPVLDVVGWEKRKS